MARLAVVTRESMSPSSPENPAVELDGVKIAFRLQGGGTYEAVDSTRLLVGEHEFVAIVGPTGCGKSTLLNAVAGLLKPSGRLGPDLRRPAHRP
jgi:NitT/TauT family transport system ATP-binding protein